MEKTFIIRKDIKGGWPTKSKIGLVKNVLSDTSFIIRTKPLFVIYFAVSHWFKFWFTIERNAVSTYYDNAFQCSRKLR